MQILVYQRRVRVQVDPVFVYLGELDGHLFFADRHTVVRYLIRPRLTGSASLVSEILTEVARQFEVYLGRRVKDYLQLRAVSLSDSLDLVSLSQSDSLSQHYVLD